MSLALRLLLGLSLSAALAAHAFDPQAASPPGGDKPDLHAAQGTVEVAFSPWDDAEGAILRAVREARRSIHVQAFVFTSRRLARALIEARTRGVLVEVVADREQTVKVENSQIPLLVAAGIPVVIEVRYASAHNKIMIIDAGETDAAVVTGSYNFTWSAQARNAENVIILRGNPSVVRAYEDNWQRHRLRALPYAEAVMSSGN
jgi:phosphatidylserine/phosphatidylglycerophosphate/cardiolipin synthase-like enzyme